MSEQSNTRSINGHTFRIGQRVQCICSDHDGYGNEVHPGVVLSIVDWRASESFGDGRVPGCWLLSRFKPVSDESPAPTQPSPAERVLAILKDHAQDNDMRWAEFSRTILREAGFTVEPQPAWRITEPAS